MESGTEVVGYQVWEYQGNSFGKAYNTICFARQVKG